MDELAATVSFIRNAMRQDCLTVEAAAGRLAPLIRTDALIDAAVAHIREEGRKNQILKVPGGVESMEYKQLTSEARRLHWYEGPQETDRFFPPLKRRMLTDGLSPEAVEVIDRSSTNVVAHLPDPGLHGLSKKGLVVGYVQSGKTANYAAVLAKAADAGFRLLIVLSGIHNGLRRQTQVRLDRDLSDTPDSPWYRLTDATADFGPQPPGGAVLNSPDIRCLAVVKKNARRLTNIVEWLEKIPEHIRRSCPAIIIDDEADQATPNTAAAKQELSKINDLIRQLVRLLPSASYVGYTATPFANVLLDPRDAEELYPSDFIVDLPRPQGYFGAEQLFGRHSLDDADEPDDGLDMIRIIPQDEADGLRPPRKKELREAFDPELGTCLEEAISWFVLAVAARRARGQGARHSSMLVHASPYVSPQFAMADRIRHHVAWMAANLDLEAFRRIWELESGRVPAEALSETPVAFESLAPHLADVLHDLRVVVDNGVSEVRLDYGRTATRSDGSEHPVTETVIAVGGDTLSRGLTLEGLIVSYFIRNSNTYDTLLQMGRWFGFRRGYADLPRIWMTADLQSAFRFLATVEAEIRLEMRRYEEEAVTPETLGLRIRTHPQLAITAASKMHHAKQVNVTYGGRTHQTFVFDLSPAGLPVLKHNLKVAGDLLEAALAAGASLETSKRSPRWILRDVPAEIITEFLGSYRFHDKHRELDNRAITSYLGKRNDDAARFWNVAVIGAGGKRRKITLGPIPDVPVITRARLQDSSDSEADIKAVMSLRDRTVDLDKHDGDDQALRGQLVNGRGLLVLYPIDRDSSPGTEKSMLTRKPLGALEDVLGVGIVFPSAAGTERSVGEAEYVSVIVPGADDTYDDEVFDEGLLVDNEADYLPEEPDPA